MEKSWNFISYFLWVPCRVKKGKGVLFNMASQRKPGSLFPAEATEGVFYFYFNTYTFLLFIPYYNHYVPRRRGGGHVVFGVDPVGISVSVGVSLSCLHNIL